MANIFEKASEYLFGGAKGARQTAPIDTSVYQYRPGEDPTEKAMMNYGMGLVRGLETPYGATPQIRLAGEGNPQQLAAARGRRNKQYAAAGLPDVGFDAGLAGAKGQSMDNAGINKRNFGLMHSAMQPKAGPGPSLI